MVLAAMNSGSIIPSLRATTRKQAILELSTRLSQQTGLDSRVIYDAVMAREQTDGTGIGRGLAIPHARIAGLEKSVVAFASMHQPIDFDAIDGQPVDLIFVLLAPDNQRNDHLTDLSRMTRILRDPTIGEKLRGSQGAYALLAVLMEASQNNKAA